MHTTCDYALLALQFCSGLSNHHRVDAAQRGCGSHSFCHRAPQELGEVGPVALASQLVELLHHPLLSRCHLLLWLAAASLASSSSRCRSAKEATGAVVMGSLLPHDDGSEATSGTT